MTPDAYMRAESHSHRLDRSKVNPVVWGRATILSRGYRRGGGAHLLIDAYGRERWLTDIGMQVQSAAMRHIFAGTQTTARQMARDLEVCDQTVRRWILKLTAWGLIGSAVAKGRYGGMVLFARTQRDTLERYAQAARDRLRAIWRARHPDVIQCDTPTDSDVGNGGVALEFEREREVREHAFADAIGADPSRPKRRVRCPAHQGDGLNVSWWWMSSGILAVKCWSHGCTRKDMLLATNLWRP